MVVIGSFALFTSCTDDLNVTPEDDDIFLTEAYFNSPGSYKTGLGGVYANLSLTGLNGAGSSNIQGLDAGTSQFGRCLWNLQNLTTDEVIWSYENDPGLAELQRNTWTSSNVIILGMYSRTMAQVAFCNEYLRQTSAAKLSARGVTDAALLADISLYREEARALRAYSYIQLVSFFSVDPANPNALGVILSTTPDRYDLFKDRPRVSNQLIYNLIEFPYQT